MDLKQRKLSKSEWDSIEIPVSKNENEILQLIAKGYSNVNIKNNKIDSLFTYLKIEYSDKIEEFLYAKYFSEKIQNIVTQFNIPFITFGIKKPHDDKPTDYIIYNINIIGIVRLKSGDQIRMTKLDTIDENITDIYEFVLYKHLENMVKFKHEKNKKWIYHYYTLNKLLQNNIEKINKYLKEVISCFMDNFEKNIELLYILQNSVEFIEKNNNLLKYSDLYLYQHQKEIFTACKNTQPKLILYIAPTGTGKTLTPIGLSEGHKIIFVCAARHVGLALARSAISINKKIAFAFGCSSAEDVRLHYFAAREYTKNKRTGQIKKVDNTVGDKVEIMICDIRSYIPAMYYMLAFNNATDIITYWDEPTITMDYTTHDLHKIIKKNWKENVIPNVVLSSATLPKKHELTHTISDFHEKFKNGMTYNIVSHDCRKTIPIINNNGYVVMPHYLSHDYSDILETIKHCEENLTLLRYFDLKEASDFICFVEKNNFNNLKSKFNRNFATVNDIDMKTIKMHYIKVLKNILPGTWGAIYTDFNISRKKRITHNSTIDTKGNKISRTTSLGNNSLNNSSMNGQELTRFNSEQISTSIHQSDNDVSGSCGIYVTTKDAYTLTDGPTIFLANDLQKIAKFCIQQSNIPAVVMKDINEKIEFNNQINEKIAEIEKILEFEEEKIAKKLTGQTDGKKDKKDTKNKSKIANNLVGKTEDVKIVNLREKLSALKSMIKRASLDDLFVPNKLQHIKKWAENYDTQNAFTSDIEDDVIISIMMLKDVEDSWKILLLLGIGVFTEHKSNDYTEIMKKLADKQKLYLIIADSDYIYGTNYQFCHGYLSKDLGLTQEKIIQALGRIGRNNIQQEYSARFRDDSQIKILFTNFSAEDKPEVINMNQLFNCKNIKWNGATYEEFPEEELVGDFENDADYDDDDNDDDNDD